MRSNFLNVFLVLIVFSLSPSAACSLDFPKKISPEAVKGVLDLTYWDFERDGSVNLSGEYEFYWNQHLEPSDFSKESSAEKNWVHQSARILD